MKNNVKTTTTLMGRSHYLIVAWSAMVMVGASCAMPAWAKHPVEIQSAKTQTALIELYTSEGCSSCPPADRWVSSLKNNAGLWKRFIPVVFHVDYWDKLGWKDPLASADFTKRQRVYARLWNDRSVYTPCMVFNGAAWKGWARRLPMPRPSPLEVGKLRIRGGDFDHYGIIFEPRQRGKNWYAHVALIGFGIESDVVNGENAGLKLDHDFSVLAYEQNKMEADGSSFVTAVTLSRSEPVDVKRYGIVAWVSRESSPIPVQAVGTVLPD